MENLFFLALLAVVGLLRWLSQMAEEKKNREAAKRAQPPAPNAPIPRAPVDSEEERIRKFMEALGVPTTTARPEIPPRDTPAPPPEAPPRKPPLMPIDPFPKPGPFFPRPPAPAPSGGPVAPPPLIPPAPTPVPTRTGVEPPPLPSHAPTISAPPPRRKPAVRRAVSEPDAYAIHDEIGYEDPARTEAAPPAAGAALSSATLVARLATRQGLRDAIVLREIFGPPRSMQPLELDRAS